MTGPDVATNPRREAFERLGARYDVRVLEPSPPAVREPPWFADDPVAIEPRTGQPLVMPVSGGDLTWNELAHDDAQLADWCADRWLGAWRRLPSLGDTGTFATTRTALHSLAEHVLAPARHASNGKIGLRFTRHGFGTPFYGNDEQCAVRDANLVVIRGEHASVAPITTARAAAELVGGPLGMPPGLYETTTTLEPDVPLVIEPEAEFLLAEWFGFASSVLEELRSGAADAAPSRVQLWPGHFDLSVDLGDEDYGARGTFGASPGDDTHGEPYLYVTHWSDVPDDPFWNDAAFDGASVLYDALDAADDQRARALDFFRRGRQVLGA
jgi:hypothetical protein